MERLNLVLKEKERICEILIGFGLFEALGENLMEKPLGNRMGIVTDTKVESILGHGLKDQLARTGIPVDLMTIPPGEESKQWYAVSKICEEMIRLGYDRKSGLIALGGGVVGDVTGFVASLYMRSIPYIQVPTTLLAQVDSSLGGKNGIDLPSGKNLLGTIYQPQRVYIDPAVLATLPAEEFQNGLAEVVKTAIVRDRSFFDYLESSQGEILERRPERLEQVVGRCCTIKTGVVMEDEADFGVRRVLNFGHTVGHAIEAYTSFRVPHGLAVSMGMAAETALSARMGLLPGREEERVVRLLDRYGLPTGIPRSYDIERLLILMRSDKKTADGEITMALPVTVGNVVVRKGIHEEMIRATLKGALS
jgi:3-dehydroquinate synthase